MSIKPNVIILDIEATSLNADGGHLVCVGWIDGLDGPPRSAFVKRVEEEKKVLKKLLQLLDETHICFTWNGNLFDIPFITTRCIKYRLDPAPIYRIRHIDVADVVKSNLKLSSNSMWSVCRFLGIGKDQSTIGADIPALYAEYLAGKKLNKSLIVRHCLDDLEATRAIIKRLLPLLTAVLRDLPSLS